MKAVVLSLCDICVEYICSSDAFFPDEEEQIVSPCFNQLPEEVTQKILSKLETMGKLSLPVLKQFKNCNLTRLNLALISTKSEKLRTRVTDEWLYYVATTHTSLTRLDLTQSYRITNEGVVRILSSIPSLTFLDLGKCKRISNDGLGGINELKELRGLALSATLVTDSLFTTLLSPSSLTSLTYLDISATPITDKGLASLSDLKNLTELNVSATRITNESCPVIGGFSSLTSLNISFTFVSEDIGQLSNLANLEILNLSLSAAITDVALQSISGMTTLRKLNLSRTGITPLSSEVLKEFTQLESLEFDATSLPDEGLDFISGLTNLQTISAMYTTIADRHLTALQNLKKLEFLKLTWCPQITDVGVNILCEGCQALTSLDIGSRCITNSSIRFLTTLPALNSLSLWETAITTTAIEGLSVLTNLTPLDSRMNTTKGTYIFKPEPT